jgi:uncharacterized protein
MPSPAPHGARRRVSHRRYLIRRLVAVAVVGVIVLGAARVIVSIGNTDDEGTAEASGTVDTAQPTSSVVPAVPSSPVTVDADQTGASTVVTSAPSTVPDDTGPPTPASPARVLIAGDSDAGTFGPYLERLLDQTGVVETVLDYKVSSGLARPDYFDWQAELRAKVPAVDPDIVIVTFGGNDAQGLADASGDFVVGEPRADSDNAEWQEEYGRRVGEVMDFLAADGRTVIWVGIPNDDSPDVTLRMQVQDETAKAEAAERPGVVFVDTWSRFSGRNGGWAEYVIDPRDGQGKDVRSDDGFHLNETGAEILALDIAEYVRNDLRRRGAEL